jgi:hypothetical protein
MGQELSSPNLFSAELGMAILQRKTPDTDTFSAYGAEHGSSLIHPQGAHKNTNGFQWYGFEQKPSVLPFTPGVWPGMVPFNSMRFYGGSLLVFLPSGYLT